MIAELHATNRKRVPSDQVRQFRYQLGNDINPATQQYMADAFGVTQSTWSGWESDGVPAGPAAKLFRIARSDVYLNRKDKP